MPQDIWLDRIYWEDAVSDVPAIRPREVALPVASPDQVLLGVPHLETTGTVRLPPPYLVANGYRYGPNDILIGVMVGGGGGEPVERHLYRVTRIGRVPGTRQKVIQLEKIARPI